MRTLVIVSLIFVAGCFGVSQKSQPSADFEQIKKEIDESRRELAGEISKAEKSVREVSGTMTEMREEINTNMSTITETVTRIDETTTVTMQSTSQVQTNDPKLIIGLAIVAAATLLFLVLAGLAFLLLRSLKRGKSAIFG